MEEAAREQRLLDALRALPGVGERAGVWDGVHSEWAQEPEGLAAVRARTALFGYGPPRAERAERAAYEALIAAFQAWLAQCCHRTPRDCVPEHVTIFMETVFVPAHLDSTSASGARCCAWQTVQLALRHLRGWFDRVGRSDTWSVRPASSAACAGRYNPADSPEVDDWQRAYRNAVSNDMHAFHLSAAPATAAAGGTPVEQGRAAVRARVRQSYYLGRGGQKSIAIMQRFEAWAAETSRCTCDTATDVDVVMFLETTVWLGLDANTGSVRCCVPESASSNADYLCHAFALLGRRYPWTWEAEDMGLTHLCNPATSQRVRNWLDAYSTYAVDGLGYMSSPPRRH